MLSSNSLYKVAFQNASITLYMPIDLTSYHKSREVAMQAQERYSKAGVSKEVLSDICSRAIEMCNKTTYVDTLRTDMGVLWNNLLARMNDPVDEYCCLRMGAIACFLEDEDPDKVEMAWTEKKIRLAFEHPDLYAFFLDTGISFTPVYNSLLRGLSVEDYLNNRKEMLKGLTIQNTTKTG